MLMHCRVALNGYHVEQGKVWRALERIKADDDTIAVM
jgi:hypothetical protein